MADDDAANADRLTVVLTGAESVGKTTLAAGIAAALGVPWVPEFARSYLEGRERYDRGDLLAIAAGQEAAEAAASAARLLVADTDQLVIRVWCEVRFGDVDRSIEAAIARAFAGTRRFYLIPRPDIPWQPDRLREHPTARAALHRKHLALLRELRADYVEIGGTREARLAAALGAIGERITPRAR